MCKKLRIVATRIFNVAVADCYCYKIPDNTLISLNCWRAMYFNIFVYINF